jgi:hypothetical protein
MTTKLRLKLTIPQVRQPGITTICLCRRAGALGHKAVMATSTRSLIEVRVVEVCCKVLDVIARSPRLARVADIPVRARDVNFLLLPSLEGGRCSGSKACKQKS